MKANNKPYGPENRSKCTSCPFFLSCPLASSKQAERISRCHLTVLPENNRQTMLRPLPAGTKLFLTTVSLN